MEGGVSNIAQQYIKANTKYIKPYNKNKPSKYIAHLDTNYLDELAMNLC